MQLCKPFEVDGRRVTLIDTPGFDDTTKSDADILSMIAAFLNASWVELLFAVSASLTPSVDTSRGLN